MIDELKDRHSVAWLCRQLGVARSGFYAWRQRQEAPGQRAAENTRLTAEIAAVFREHCGFYGSPRVHQELAAAGLRVGRHRVARLMQRGEPRARTPQGVPALPQRQQRRLWGAENVLQQDFQPPAPNRCWAGDITYVCTTAGWRYLAVSDREVR